MKACMGGFCQKREKCQHYMSPTNKYRPAERLCTQGQEEWMFFAPLRRTDLPVAQSIQARINKSPLKQEQEQMV